MATLTTYKSTGGAVGDLATDKPGYRIQAIIDAGKGFYAWEPLPGAESVLDRQTVDQMIEDSDSLVMKGELDTTATQLPAADAGHVYEITTAVTLGGEDLAQNSYIYAVSDATAAGATFVGNWKYLEKPATADGSVPVFVVSALPATPADGVSVYLVSDAIAPAADPDQKGLWVSTGDAYFAQEFRNIS